MTQPSDRLLDAVVDLVATQGLEAVSVRAVAARAGVSIGAVQHHFPTKRAMLLGAVDRVGDAVTRRLEAAVDASGSAEEALRAVARTLVATDPDDRAGTAVWVAFLSHAFADDAAAQRHRADWQEVEQLFARLLAEHRGTTADRTADDAAHLLALLDGLSVAVALEPARMPPGRALAVVDALLDELLDVSPKGRGRGRA